jgi:hypothetical protein
MAFELVTGCICKAGSVSQPTFVNAIIVNAIVLSDDDDKNVN